jgi:hypothetical protein
MVEKGVSHVSKRSLDKTWVGVGMVLQSNLFWVFWVWGFSHLRRVVLAQDYQMM